MTLEAEPGNQVRASLIAVRSFFRRSRRQQDLPAKRLEGEEYEIAKAEADAQEDRDRYTAKLFRNIGNLRYPFLKDPFD